jgi:hypothetical protein
MVNTSQERLRVATQTAKIFSVDSTCVGVDVIGSCAAGQCDEFSDAELTVFWRGGIDKRRELERVEAAGGRHLVSSDIDGTDHDMVCSQSFLFEGIKIDVQHWSAAAATRRIDDVLAARDLAPNSQIFLSNLLRGRSIHETDIVQGWRRQAAAYPDSLRTAFLASNLIFQTEEIMRMYAARGDWLVFWSNIVGIHKRIVLVLCAVNRVYFPGYKWIESLLTEFPIAPRTLADRMRGAYGTNLQSSAKDTIALVEDVLEVVVRQVPSVDVENVRAGVRASRLQGT